MIKNIIDEKYLEYEKNIKFLLKDSKENKADLKEKIIQIKDFVLV